MNTTVDAMVTGTLRSHTRPTTNPNGSELVTASTLQGGGKRGHRVDAEGAAGGHLVAHTLRSERFDASEDGTGRGTPLTTFHATQEPITEQDGTLALGASAYLGAQDAAQMVRRLTPVECERLQNWPDGWTLPEGPSLADEPNHPHRTDEDCPKPDGPRYAAAGDGVTASVSEFIGRRILSYEQERELAA